MDSTINVALDSAEPKVRAGSDGSDRLQSFQSQVLAYAYARPDRGTNIPKIETSDLLAAADGAGFDAGEIVSGLLDGAICKPGKALEQVLGLGNYNPDDDNASKLSSSRQTGLAVGTLVPYVGLVGLTRQATAELLGECAGPPLLRLMGEQAAAGFLLGSLLTPSKAGCGQGLILARLNQGGLSAATYASILGTAASLEQALPKPEGKTGVIPNVVRQVSITALSGTMCDFIDLEGITGFGNLSVEESLSSIMGTAAIGTLADKPDSTRPAATN